MKPTLGRDRALEPVEVLGGARPSPRHAGLERRERHALDPGQHAHAGSRRPASRERRHAEAAVARRPPMVTPWRIDGLSVGSQNTCAS